MVFHWSLSGSKSPRVSRTLLCYQAVLNNVVVWMVSTRPPTSKSFRSFNNPLVTVSKAPVMIGTIVTFMFHSFFNSLVRSRYSFFLSHSFSFNLWSAGTAKSTILQILFFDDATLCINKTQRGKRRTATSSPSRRKATSESQRTTQVKLFLP